MNWDAIGAIAELLGAIGVIASLIYLATQIRQSRDQMERNTRATQAASNHLNKLLNAKLLAVIKQGQHKYYRYADDNIAQAIESIASLLPLASRSSPTDRPNGIEFARCCYDHLAGKVGVEITNALLHQQVLTVVKNRYDIGEKGKKWFEGLGIDLHQVHQKKRKFAFPCLDWSERKHHLGGALGAAFLTAIVENDWVRKTRRSREIIITSIGKMAMQRRGLVVF